MHFDALAAILASPDGVDVIDISEESTASLRYEVIDEDGIVVEHVFVRVPIPEDKMDDLEKLIGNGQATITVGKELKVSENYKTAGSVAYVKLTCNQDLQTILQAREEATALALGFAEQGFEQALYIMDKMSGKDVEPPPPLELLSESVSIGKKEPEPPQAPTKSPESRKQPIRKKVLGKNKPQFKR